MPDSMIAAINSEVPTGRRMKGSETFIALLHRCASRPASALERDLFRPAFARRSIELNDSSGLQGPSRRRETGIHLSESCFTDFRTAAGFANGPNAGRKTGFGLALPLTLQAAFRSGRLRRQPP